MPLRKCGDKCTVGEGDRIGLAIILLGGVQNRAVHIPLVLLGQVHQRHVLGLEVQLLGISGGKPLLILRRKGDDSLPQRFHIVGQGGFARVSEIIARRIIGGSDRGRQSGHRALHGGAVSLDNHELVHVPHALGHLLQTEAGVNDRILGRLLIGEDEEAVPGLKLGVGGVPQGIGHPGIIGPAQKARSAYGVGVEHGPITLAGGAEGKISGLVTGAGVNGGAQPRLLPRGQHTVKVAATTFNRHGSYVQIIDANGKSLMAGVHGVHGSRFFEGLAVGPLYALNQGQRRVVDPPLVDADVGPFLPAVGLHMGHQIGEEGRPALVPGGGVALADDLLGPAVVQIADLVGPWSRAVAHDLVSNTDLIDVKTDPSVEVGVVKDPLPRRVFAPRHHAGDMDLILAVSLPRPCVLGNGGGNSVSADVPILLHDGLQNGKMLLGERRNIVVFCRGVGILPQLDVKAVLKFRSIRKDGGSYVKGVRKGELLGVGQTARRHGNFTLICTWLGILGNVDRDPKALHLPRLHVHRCVAHEHLGSVLAAALRHGHTVGVSPAVHPSIRLHYFYKGKIYVFSGNGVAVAVGEGPSGGNDACLSGFPRCQEYLGYGGIVAPRVQGRALGIRGQSSAKICLDILKVVVHNGAVQRLGEIFKVRRRVRVHHGGSDGEHPALSSAYHGKLGGSGSKVYLVVATHRDGADVQILAVIHALDGVPAAFIHSQPEHMVGLVFQAAVGKGVGIPGHGILPAGIRSCRLGIHLPVFVSGADRLRVPDDIDTTALNFGSRTARNSVLVH